MKNTENIKFNFMTIVLIFSIFSVGLFYEYLSCILSILLFVYLSYILKNEQKIVFKTNISSIAILIISISYAVVSFWAIDKGDAIVGFFKFLPISIYVLIIMQNEKYKPSVEVIPYSMAIMTIISSILMQISSVSKYFSASGRLSGFIQYSNTFALLLLISLIILVTKESLNKTDFILIPILLFGIIYSGSRTVFVLMLIAIIILILAGKNKRTKIVLVTSTVVIIIAVIIYALITKNYESAGRFLTISLNESTFVGRFLYFQDALPVILKHPFGLGYMGYYYIEQSIQTGVYSVKYIHNDFLQLMLDIGWIPTFAFIAAILKSLFKKGMSIRNRVAILVISAHCFFDFDLQYIAVFMLFVSFFDYDNGKEFELDNKPVAKGIVMSVLICLCAYIGVSQLLFTFNLNKASDKMLPNTQARIEMLMETSNAVEMETIADTIIKTNKNVAIAYSAKANVAFSKGDIKSFMTYKNKAIELAPFENSEYVQYCSMLIKASQMYQQSGDLYSSEYCINEVINTVEKLNNSKNRLSDLGRRIDDQPNLTLPNEIREFVEEYSNG